MPVPDNGADAERHQMRRAKCGFQAMGDGKLSAISTDLRRFQNDMRDPCVETGVGRFNGDCHVFPDRVRVRRGICG